MLVVIYSYGGTEIIGVTLAETKNPEKVVPKAVRSTLVRIISFYIIPFFIIVSLIPWNEVNGVKESPFVMVFQMIRIQVPTISANAVVLLAIISSMNSGLYGSSAFCIHKPWMVAFENLFPFIRRKCRCSCNVDVYFRFIWRCIDFLICWKQDLRFSNGFAGMDTCIIHLVDLLLSPRFEIT